MKSFSELSGLTKSELTTELANGGSRSSSSGPFVNFNNDGTITQTERLFTVRPRYAPKASSASDVYQKGLASRGTHAYIKLLTSPDQSSKYSASRGAREQAELSGPGSHLSRMASSNSDEGYDAFLLTAVSCQMQEKLQVTEVFGDGEVAYYFGRQPLMFNISGILMDSPDNTWFTDFLKMYSSVLRGSQLAQNNELLKIVLPNMTITGTVMSAGWSQDASNDVSIPFQMQFLAKRIDPTAPVLQTVSQADLQNLIDFGKAGEWVTQGQSAINAIKNSVAGLESTLANPGSTVGKIGEALSKFTGFGGSGSLSKLTGFLGGAGLPSPLAGISSLFRTVSANLNGIRTQLFAPIYGVLTSLTKLVKNTFGDVNSIFNSIFSPVKNILRDITNISNQATSLVNLVNRSIRGVGRNLNYQLSSTKKQYNDAMKAVGKARGSIASSPQTVLQSLQGMMSGGAIPSNAAFLQANPKASLSSASISKGSRRADYKLAILSGSTPYSVPGAASL